MILIYESAADFNRLPVWADILDGLADLGFPCCFLVERLHVRHDGRVIDNLRSIRAYMPANSLHRCRVLEGSPQADEQFWSEFLTENPSLCGLMIWNGSGPQKESCLSSFRKMGMPTCYLENGWLQPDNSVSVDIRGVGGDHSLAVHGPSPMPEPAIRQTRAYLSDAPLGLSQANRSISRILVPLQLEYDSNISLYSPFQTMSGYLSYLDDWLPQSVDVRVRRHPLAADTPLLPARFKLSNNSLLSQDLQWADCVVGINSTVLVQALALGLAVVAHGDGVLSKTEAAVHPEHSVAFPEAFERAEPERLNFLANLVVKHQIARSNLRDGQALLRNQVIAEFVELCTRSGIKRVDPISHLSMRRITGLDRFLGLAFRCRLFAHNWASRVAGLLGRS